MDDITPEQLRAWRLNAHMTQEKLGVQLGLKKVAVTKIENGKRKISAAEQKLFKLLIHGEMPFSTAQIDAKNSQLQFSPEQWEIIHLASKREGYDDTRSWIVDKIRGYLRMKPETALPQMAAEASIPYNPKSKNNQKD